jgi:hypothetical protein
MANRTFNDAQALEKEVKTLYAKISIGASGAPTLVKPGSLGIASVSKVSTGLYRITLEDAYPALLGARVISLASSAADVTFQVKLETVSSTKLVEVFCLASGSVVEPASGTVLFVELSLKNTSVNY